MNIKEISVPGWEKIIHIEAPSAGLNAIISVHDVTLGPACGGCRVFPYKSFEDGLNDVTRLSRGMTYKNALGGIPFGGGKSVIFADPARDKTPEMMHALGDVLNELGGLYYTAQDSGMAEEDIRNILSRSPYAAGAGNDGIGGAPGPHTARGVWRGIQAAARHKLKRDSLQDLRIGIMGLGSVGMSLANYLHESGAKLFVSDVNKAAVEEAQNRFGAIAMSPEEIIAADIDIFSPCALGGSINVDTVDTIKAKIVAGAANNQLHTPDMGAHLLARNILYAPDYVINAAGVISIGLEILEQWDLDRLNQRIDLIGATLETLFERAERENAPTNEVADAMAQDFIKNAVTENSAA